MKKIYEKYLWEYEQAHYGHVIRPAHRNAGVVGGQRGSKLAMAGPTKKRKVEMSSGGTSSKRRDISQHSLLSGATAAMMSNVTDLPNPKKKVREGPDALFNVTAQASVESGFMVRSAPLSK